MISFGPRLRYFEKVADNDDLISLEDLVREDAAGGAVGATESTGRSAGTQANASSPLGVVEQTLSPTSVATATPPLAAAPSIMGDSPADFLSGPSLGPSIEAVPDVDGILAQEDPQFVESMRELEKTAHEISAASRADIPGESIESIQAEAEAQDPSLGQRFRALIDEVRRRVVERTTKPKQNFIHFLKETAPKLGKESKIAALALLRLSFEGLKNLFHATQILKNRFFELPRRSKLIVGLAALMGLSALFVLDITFNGKIARNLGLSLQANYLHSMAEGADQAFTYNEEEPKEDFTDPLYHPEHVIEIEHLVVNLRPVAEHTNPMGVFAFYIETSNQESAVELKDRTAEARDVIGRSLEQMSQEGLATIEGKEKAKIMIRKSLNAILTRGQVRRIFIKNVVLKP